MTVQISTSNSSTAFADLLSHALSYSACGLSIIPIGREKKPAMRGWKEYQARRADESHIRQWFTSGKGIQGIGIVCGSVSGNLAVRDFDNPESYEQWSEANPALAANLPTVQTSRGYHVYFRLAQSQKTQTFEDGELRGDGAYVLAPPSRHPAGCIYQWIHPLVNEIPVIADVEIFSMLQRVQREPRVTERTEEISSVHSALSVLSVTSPGVERAIMQTLPTESGQRHRQVFKLARALKGISVTANGELSALKPIVKHWHEQALPFITTKNFDETWSDFVNAWPNVKFALGESPMDTIIENLQMLAPPPEAGLYETPGVKLLVALCTELQRQAGSELFYLDNRTAGRLLSVEPMTVWRWLKMLKADGLLAEVETGRPGRATRWRWIGRNG